MWFASKIFGCCCCCNKDENDPSTGHDDIDIVRTDTNVSCCNKEERVEIVVRDRHEADRLRQYITFRKGRYKEMKRKGKRMELAI